MIPLLVCRFPKKLAPNNVYNSKLRNPPFCFYASFSIVSPAYFINKLDSPRDLTIFMISSIFSFEIINVVIPDAKIFSKILASTAAAAAAAANPNGIKTYLTYGLSVFFIKGKPVFSKGPRSLARNTPDCTILDSSVFNNFTLADEIFAKVLRSLQTCLSVNYDLCEKLVLSLELPIIFDERVNVTSVAVFIPDFNLSNCELVNFTVKLSYWDTLY